MRFDKSRKHQDLVQDSRCAIPVFRFIAAYTFLGRNGYQLIAPEVDATLKTLGLASGELSQERYAEWIEANSKRAARCRKQ